MDVSDDDEEYHVPGSVQCACAWRLSVAFMRRRPGRLLCKRPSAGQRNERCGGFGGIFVCTGWSLWSRIRRCRTSFCDFRMDPTGTWSAATLTATEISSSGTCSRRSPECQTLSALVSSTQIGSWAARIFLRVRCMMIRRVTYVALDRLPVRTSKTRLHMGDPVKSSAMEDASIGFVLPLAVPIITSNFHGGVGRGRKEFFVRNADVLEVDVVQDAEFATLFRQDHVPYQGYKGFFGVLHAAALPPAKGQYVAGLWRQFIGEVQSSACMVKVGKLGPVRLLPREVKSQTWVKGPEFDCVYYASSELKTDPGHSGKPVSWVYTHGHETFLVGIGHVQGSEARDVSVRGSVDVEVVVLIHSIIKLAML